MCGFDKAVCYGFVFRAFRQGMHDLKVWPNVEADPTSQSTTPGKTKDSNDQMSRLAKVSGSGYYWFCRDHASPEFSGDVTSPSR